jgi:hypothetical protein
MDRGPGNSAQCGRILDEALSQLILPDDALVAFEAKAIVTDRAARTVSAEGGFSPIPMCYTQPLKAKKASDRIPAVTNPIEVSWSGRGTRASRIRSLTPAKSISARPKPAA